MTSQGYRINDSGFSLYTVSGTVTLFTVRQSLGAAHPELWIVK
jgi:hypothetical protein